MKFISVVTVTHNSSFVLEQFLKSIEEGKRSGDEVIVVDSGSQDVDVTRRIAMAHNARLMQLPVNVGYGVGTNAGAATAGNDWLAVVNPDVQTTFSALRDLADMAAREGIACIGPSIRDETGTPILTARGTIRPPWRREVQRTAVSGQVTTADSVSGCCMVMRTSDFHDAAGFDPYFFMFAEEIDLHKRLWESGKAVATTSAVTVMTPGGGSSSITSRRWGVTERSVAHVRYTKKHFTTLEAAIDFAWRCILIARGGEYKPRAESLRQFTEGVFAHRSRSGLG